MNSRRWRPLALLVAVFIAGCGHAIPARYEVTAPLLAIRGHPVYACWAIELSLPPAGCGGVVVRRVDLRRVPGVHRYANGTMMTGSLRLVGTWDGHVLTVTKFPRPAASPSTERQPPCDGAVSTAPQSSALSLQQQVGRDRAALEQRGIVILSTAPCGSRLGILVAVADAPTAGYLKSHYSEVDVVGWLQPI